MTDVLLKPVNSIRFLWTSAIAPMDVNHWLLCSLKDLDDARVKDFTAPRKISEIRLVNNSVNFRQNFQLEYHEFSLRKLRNTHEYLFMYSVMLPYWLLVLLNITGLDFVPTGSLAIEDISNDISSMASVNQLFSLDFLWTILVASFVSLIWLYLIPVTVIKLTARLFTHKFVDSLCALEALRISMLLNESDDLLLATRKNDISKRMEYLSKMCLLLPSGYRQGLSEQRWIKQHFKGISYYIKVRQSWLYVPQSHTLEDLRSDFSKLAKVFVTGLYGEFQPEDLPAPEKNTRISRFFRSLQVVGYLLPLLVMGFLILNPAVNPDLGIGLIWIFFISWLIIGLDRYLNLGILDPILNTAKGLKSLSGP
ncbi:MAG: hypothetical protein AAF773_04440 [Cyanobacteria bacterium P01_D01_bin.115]